MAAPEPVLGQSAPDTTGATPLFDTPGGAVPGGHRYIISSFTITPLTPNAALASIHIRPNGATLANKHKLLHTVRIQPGVVETITIGATLPAGCVVDVQSNTADALTFMAFGDDLS